MPHPAIISYDQLEDERNGKLVHRLGAALLSARRWLNFSEANRIIHNPTLRIMITYEAFATLRQQAGPKHANYFAYSTKHNRYMYRDALVYVTDGDNIDGREFIVVLESGFYQDERRHSVMMPTYQMT